MLIILLLCARKVNIRKTNNKHTEYLSRPIQVQRPTFNKTTGTTLKLKHHCMTAIFATFYSESSNKEQF